METQTTLAALLGLYPNPLSSVGDCATVVTLARIAIGIMLGSLGGLLGGLGLRGSLERADVLWCSALFAFRFSFHYEP